MNNLVQTNSLTENNLFRYIAEINKIPMLTAEEELFHSKEKDNGNLNSAKILVSSHLRLVVKIANQYKNYGLPMMDLISEGNLGLMRAVKTFDYKKGYKLATYSMWWIKAFIQEYILKSWSIVKIGTSITQKKLFFNLGKIKSNILSYNHKKYLSDKDVKEISNFLNVSPQDVVDMDCRSKGDVYLNKKVKADEDNTEILDLIPAKQALQDVVVDKKRINSRHAELLNEALNILNERELEIIKLRKLTDNPLTLAEVSKQCNISGERVRQIETRAIEKMKDYIVKTSDKI
ncbi:MAG TPA: RNA polymerase factor sigma-32 [Rickettsiales bacterium]|nr:RNA polymerase factor sigma-32 [Rickettsiales bacterium]